MKSINIKAPFYGAGTTYKWTQDGYDIQGIGIKADDINHNTELKVKVDGNTYVIETKVIRDFVRKYNSIYYAKNKTRLGVFSMTLLKQTKKELF